MSFVVAQCSTHTLHHCVSIEVHYWCNRFGCTTSAVSHSTEHKSCDIEAILAQLIVNSSCTLSLYITPTCRFCEGAASRAVQDKLSAASIKPIAADRCCLESEITACTQLTEAVQQSQQALRAEIQRELQSEEQQLYVRVLVQKELEAKQAVIKCETGVTGTFQKKLAAKRNKGFAAASNATVPIEQQQ
jgi:hypothetical protein